MGYIHSRTSRQRPVVDPHELFVWNRNARHKCVAMSHKTNRWQVVVEWGLKGQQQVNGNTSSSCDSLCDGLTLCTQSQTNSLRNRRLSPIEDSEKLLDTFLTTNPSLRGHLDCERMLCTIMANECYASECETVPSAEFNSGCITHNPSKIVVVVLVLR
jgi:hypothetical protein